MNALTCTRQPDPIDSLPGPVLRAALTLNEAISAVGTVALDPARTSTERREAQQRAHGMREASRRIPNALEGDADALTRPFLLIRDRSERPGLPAADRQDLLWQLDGYQAAVWAFDAAFRPGGAR